MRRTLLGILSLALAAGLLSAPVLAHHRPGHKPRPTVQPTPTPAPDEAMPTGNLPGWTMLFSDDFSTDVPLGQFPSAVSSRWTAYPYPWTTLGGYYYPEKVNSVSGGQLHFHLHQEGGQWLMSAPGPKIQPDGDTNQLYGRYAARFQTDALDGYYAAWLLWPKSGQWPRDGELDFPEGDLDSTIAGFVHHQGATSGGDQTKCLSGVRFADGWHTVVTEWRPASVRYYLDGRLLCEVTSRVPNTPMRWVLQTTTSPSGLPAAGTNGYLDVDWVAIWRYGP